MPHTAPHPIRPNSPDWARIRATLLADAHKHTRPTPVAQQALEGCIFDMRRDLIHTLIAAYTPNDTHTDNIKIEDALRDALPPFALTPGPYRPVSSPLQTALVAVLGLLAGSAFAQGLASVAALPAFIMILCGIGGMACALWLADRLAAAPGANRLTLLCFSVPWPPLRRWAVPLLLALLVFTVLRDFLRGHNTLADILSALGGFLAEGNALALWGNVYWALALCALFIFAALRPVRLDTEAFAERALLGAHIWWAGAACAATALIEQAARQNKADSKQWQQTGADLCSFAAELPAERRAWLEERLRRIGFFTPREDGPLVWDPALAETYNVLGHLEPGERCFVDSPPLYENDTLSCKGVLRKVR